MITAGRDASAHDISQMREVLVHAIVPGEKNGQGRQGGGEVRKKNAPAGFNALSLFIQVGQQDIISWVKDVAGEGCQVGVDISGAGSILAPL